MKKLTYLLLGTLMGGLTSCGDFLEPKSQSEYVPKDANALQEMLIGNGYPQASSGNSMLAYSDFFSDDVQLMTNPDFDFSSTVTTSDLTFKEAVFEWQPNMFDIARQTSYIYSNIWEGLYKFILGTNATLDYMDEVSGTDAEKNYVRAQAYTLRAFYYFILVNHFGQPYNYNKTAPGVPLKLDSYLAQEGKLNMARNTVEEVYNQIIADLNQAEQLYIGLPKAKQYQPDYLTSLPLVEMLKSRVYLYMENWAEAQKYAAKVISDWDFHLIDFKTLDPSLSNPQEPYYAFTTIDSPETIWLYGSINDYLVYLSTNVENINDDSVTRDAFNASDELVSCFKEGDLRKDQYLIREYNSDYAEFYTDAYTVFSKFKVSSNGEPKSGENFAMSFRLAEAYLNLAEAAAHNNDANTAHSALHDLLSTRYEEGKLIDGSDKSGNDLIEFIREERRKELCLEGQRWFDLRRYGMPQITHKWKDKTYTLKHNDPQYTMPIPEDVLERNNELTQNPLSPIRVD